MLDMKMSRRVSAACAALLFSLAAAGCHHSGKNRRGPAAGNTPEAPAGDYGSGTSRPDLGNGGRDIEPVDRPGGTIGDLGDAMGEGGPLADVRFEYDSAALTPAAQQTLSAHAVWIKDRRQARVTLEGHCDERGTVEYNLALGEQRAKAVYDHLVGLGVPAAQLQTVSLGKERPLDSAHTEEAFAKNRRVHFAVQG
jgi:peptidoglycan-associated lipoprotein